MILKCLAFGANKIDAIDRFTGSQRPEKEDQTISYGSTTVTSNAMARHGEGNKRECSEYLFDETSLDQMI